MKSKAIRIPFLAALTLALTACSFFSPQQKSKSNKEKSSNDFDSSYNYLSSDSNGGSSNSGGNGGGENNGSQLSDQSWKKHIIESYEYCEELVEQGSVLLKNDNNVLPLSNNERNITLLGRGSRNLFMRSGAGGAAPNTNLVVKLDAAFKDNGFSINEDLFSGYSNETNMTSPSTTIEKYNETNESLIDAQYGDAAIITFVRVATEDTDQPANKLDLNSDEANLLKLVKKYKDNNTFKKVIVLINSPMPMSMDWANDEQYGVDAVVYMGVPGYYGAGGVVKILTGEVNPSGHLSNTFAASASSSPAYQNFGDRNVSVYKEGIYVGYKYYETRYEDLVLGQGNANSAKGIYKSTYAWDYAEEMGYPFGFGLSYTEFDQRLTSLTYNADDDTINATVEVRNVGSIAGRASVQLYVNAPYTDYDKQYGLGKSAIALMAYDKVLLNPNERKTIDLSFDRYFLCTYDYKNARSYILEEGDYYFAVGNGAHEALNNILYIKNSSLSLVDHNGNTYYGDSSCVKKLSINNGRNAYHKSHYNNDYEVTNQFDDADYNYFANKYGKDEIVYLDRQDWDATWPTKTTTNPANSNDTNMSQYYSKSASGANYSDIDGEELNVYDENNIITFADMTKVPIEGFVTDKTSRFFGEDGADIWDAFVKQLSLDELIISIADNRGILDVRKISKQGNSISEGSEGLLAKYQYGDKRWATGYPTGPVYAGTWDHEMQKKYGYMYGKDALYCGVPCTNAPGANINRTPYGGRSSENMSEDAMLSYNAAANIVGEARKQGLIMNVKNIALNNQETGRQGIATYCNEQAIREIYLKPFEGALTKGESLGAMTSYNRIGARYAACHEPLMKNVMRGEWKYRGLIINMPRQGSNTDSYSNGPAMLHCGNDIFCLDGQRGTQLKQWITSKDDGELVYDLQRANKYVLYALSRSTIGYEFLSDDSGSESSNPQPTQTIITDKIRQDANNYDYDFDPESIVIKEKEQYDYSDSFLNSIPVDDSRYDASLVYCFEGSYAEGWQGDYSLTYCYLYLWDDGYFGGISGKENVRGFWYNSSLNAPNDNPNTQVNEAVDCLNMVSNLSHFESISATKKDGFYQYQAYMYLDMGKVWGQGTNGRSVSMSGYLYYPAVALAIDTQSDEPLDAYTGEEIDISLWTPMRVLKNLNYYPILVPTEVVWSVGNGGVSIEEKTTNNRVSSISYHTNDGTVTMNYVNNSKSQGIDSIKVRFNASGKQTIIVRWNGLQGSISVNVK